MTGRLDIAAGRWQQQPAARAKLRPSPRWLGRTVSLWLALGAAVTAASGVAGCAASSMYLTSLSERASHGGAATAATRPATAGRPSSGAEAELNEAVALIFHFQYAPAVTKLLGVLGAFQAERDDPRTAETLFWLGFCREKQGRLDDAADRYRQVIGQYPQTPAARSAAARLARIRS